MQLVRLEARDLPEGPLDAAAAFHARIVPQARQVSGSDCVVLFDPADHTHRGWRCAAVQELAREAAPCRLNGIVGLAGDGVEQTCAYLASAPGITGQLLAVADSND